MTSIFRASKRHESIYHPKLLDNQQFYFVMADPQALTPEDCLRLTPHQDKWYVYKIHPELKRNLSICGRVKQFFTEVRNFDLVEQAWWF